jgi:NitT/TauT family transport system permease protein
MPEASLSAPASRPHTRSKISAVLAPLLSALVWILVWQFAVWWFSISSVLAPAPSQVISILFSREIHNLASHGLYTGMEATAGFILALVLGLGLALAISRYGWLRDMTYPYLIGFQVVPKLALAPLFILWFGIGLTSRVAFASFICFFPIVIAGTAGLCSVSPSIIQMCRSIGASEAQILYQVRLPSAIRYIFAGMKIAATMSIIGVVIAEFISADKGLGYLILFASSNANTPIVMTSIVLLCAIGLLLYGSVAIAENRILARYAG